MKLIFLLILSFVLIASSTLVFTKNTKNQILPEIEASEVLGEKTNFPLTAVFKGTDQFPVLSAQSVLAVDLDSDTILYEKNPQELLFPASTTKIMTAMISLDYFSLDEIVRVGDISVEGQKMKLLAGEEIKVSDLIFGLLVFSANDAAEVLAQSYPGGRNSFVRAMNLRAVDIGLENTHFNNPTGLDEDGHVSTAKDLITAASLAMDNRFFREVVSTKEKVVTSVDGKIVHKLVNLNELVGEVDGVMGVKTGWTENARENLITYLERDDRKIIIAILGSQDRFGETKELINWIFLNYEWKELDYQD